MTRDTLIVLDSSDSDTLTRQLADHFDVQRATPENLQAAREGEHERLILIGPGLPPAEQLKLLERVKSADPDNLLPVLLVGPDDDVSHKVAAFEKGAEDYLSIQLPNDEFIARLRRASMHRIANAQLKRQLRMANEVAMTAMSDTSDLGINMQFLLDANRCNNFDELGQRLLQAINQYGLRCSVQIRGRFEEKNMERNGMPKDLETQLMHHLQNEGRLVEFGNRLVVNYEQVSLLVKNMPVEDERRCGTLKDNLFYLVQGADARVKALDNAHALASEMRLLTTLTGRIETMIQNVDEAYQDLTNAIVSEVERLAEEVDLRILTLDLTEEQEQTLQALLRDTVERTNAIFNQGLKVDQATRTLVSQLQKVLTDDEPERRARKLEKLVTALEKPELRQSSG
ncbi:MAG: hypothetical protein D6758_03945 [Gammaproteobacteria bacterium]|nr:MAG: hypothetical protein D6758_03945 [Gammaproteobacteria bacterium]